MGDRAGDHADRDSDRRLSPYRWVILLVSCALIFMTNYLQFQVSSLAPLIVPRFGLDSVQLSSLLLAPLLSGVFLSIPGGVLCDRFGPRAVVAVATAVSVAASFARVGAGDYPTLFCAMFLLGCCPAVLQASLIKLFCIWFKRSSNMAMGIYFASASVGIACAQATSNLFADMAVAFLVPSALFLACAAAWALFARDVPKGEEPPKGEPVARYLKTAAASKNVWLVALAVGLGMATSTAYVGLFPQALFEVHGLDPESAGATAAILSLGSIAGSMLGPLVCQRLGSVKGALAVIVVLGGIAKLLSWTLFGTVGIAAMLLVNGALGSAAGPVLEALPGAFPEIGHKYAGSAGGVVGSVSLAISYGMPLAVSGIAGADYSLNLILESLCFALAVVPIVLLSKVREAPVVAPVGAPALPVTDAAPDPASDPAPLP